MLYVQLAAILAVIIVLASGLRPSYVGSDTLVYVSVYERLALGLDAVHSFEFLYEGLSQLMAWAGFTVRGLFIAVSAISFLFIFSSFHNFNVYFKKAGLEPDLYLYGIIFLAISIIFLSAQTNIIRHGVASFALICFYSCLLSRKKVALSLISAVVAIGFHNTSVLYLLLGVLVFIPRRAVVFITMAAAASYISGLSEFIVAWVSSVTGLDVHGRITEYGMYEQYRTGVRYDFALFSLFIGAIFEIAAKTLFFAQDRFSARECLKVYWLLLLPFFAFGYGAFSDRLLFAAWLFASFFMALIVSHGCFLYRGALRPLALWVAFICAVIYALSILQWLK